MKDDINRQKKELANIRIYIRDLKTEIHSQKFKLYDTELKNIKLAKYRGLNIVKSSIIKNIEYYKNVNKNYTYKVTYGNISNGAYEVLEIQNFNTMHEAKLTFDNIQPLLKNNQYVLLYSSNGDRLFFENIKNEGETNYES
jgi:hypothetical protein